MSEGEPPIRQAEGLGYTFTHARDRMDRALDSERGLPGPTRSQYRVKYPQ